MTQDWQDVALEQAGNHVKWLIETIEPLLIDNFIHGFKHGREHAATEQAGTQEKVEN